MSDFILLAQDEITELARFGRAIKFFKEQNTILFEVSVVHLSYKERCNLIDIINGESGSDFLFLTASVGGSDWMKGSCYKLNAKNIERLSETDYNEQLAGEKELLLANVVDVEQFDM